MIIERKVISMFSKEKYKKKYISPKGYNIIFLLILTVSIVLIVLMKNDYIELNIFAIVPYIFTFIFVWLLISLNMLRAAIKNLYDVPTERRIESFGKLLKSTFFTETFIKREALVDVYSHVIELDQISYTAKVKLYDVFERKCIYVPYPRNKNNRKKTKR